MEGVSNSGRGGIQCEYDWENVEPAVAVLESIAVFEHGDVSEAASVVDPPLQRYVDVDALNAMVRGEGTSSIALDIGDYRVRVRGEFVEVTRSDR